MQLQDDSLWKSLALDKWGIAVETLSAPIVSEGGWLQYCADRMNLTAAPKSPLDLGQEQYPDPWEHLVCCILCSRTSGGPLIRATLHNFIACWSSPTAVLAATDDVLCNAINPLGLQINRIKALKSMSHDFLAKNWKLPSEFSGCGKFTSDSWRIFCRGHRKLEDVEDKNLKRYLHWVLNGSSQKSKSGKKKEENGGKKVKGRKFLKSSFSTKTRAGKGAAGSGGSTSRVRKTVAARGIKTRQTRSSNG